MLRKIICVVAILFTPLSHARDNSERHYQGLDCAQRNGITEYKLEDSTRVDCLTEDYAIEHDFASKWYECLAQTMHYAMLTDRLPKCVLIVERPADQKYVDRARLLVKHYQLPVTIETVINKPNHTYKGIQR